MASKKSARQAVAAADVDDLNVVLFQGPTTGAKPGAVQLHSFGSTLKGKLFGRKLEDVREDFQKTAQQIAEILDNAFLKLPQGLSLDAVEVSLGFSAEGKLAFIAEAGMEASVTVTFKKS